MRGGIWVLNIFAAIWFVVGVIGAGLPWAALVIPAAVSGALLGWGSRAAADSRVPAAHVGRLVGIWSAIQGVAIFVAVTICQNIGARDAIVPVIAIIVGLHFLPLARGIPVPLYYATGLALIVQGLGAMLLPGDQRMALVGFTAAVILWVSAALLIRQARSRQAG